jgi:GT2 family glycosyltransferase
VPPAVNPTVTVVVVNWNRRELLGACLRSLAAQTHPNFQVVVVDNGSEDGSPDLVREMTASFPAPLSLVTNSVNRGFCAANNQGFAASRSELVALLNNDAEAEPGWLAALEAVIRTSDDVGMAASKILVWEDPRRIDKAGHLIYPDGQNRGLFRLRR